MLDIDPHRITAGNKERRKIITTAVGPRREGNPAKKTKTNFIHFFTGGNLWKLKPLS